MQRCVYKNAYNVAVAETAAQAGTPSVRVICTTLDIFQLIQSVARVSRRQLSVLLSVTGASESGKWMSTVEGGA